MMSLRTVTGIIVANELSAAPFTVTIVIVPLGQSDRAAH